MKDWCASNETCSEAREEVCKSGDSLWFLFHDRFCHSGADSAAQTVFSDFMAVVTEYIKEATIYYL